MINLRLNNELLNGLVGRVLARILQNKLNLNTEIDPRDISVSVEGATTKIFINAVLSLPTSELETLIKKNMF